jgi:chromosome partitioning protein
MLRQGLKRLINTPDRSHYTMGNRRARVIAISSQKGGVGKTTTAVCLGAAFARFHDLSTLILDMDPQGHVQKSLHQHALGTGGRLSQVLLSTSQADVLDSVVSTTIDHLHITPSDPALAETESLIGTRIGKEFLLRDALRVTRTHYDIVLIDCPPNLGNLTLNALVASDWVLVPCDASPLAIQGVNDIVRTMATIELRLNRELDLLGILLTRLDARNSTVNEAAVDALQSDYGDLLFSNSIGVNTTLAKAQFDGTSLFQFDANSRAAKHYRKLSEEVVERISGLH